jgi:hypothetical protein
MAIFNSYVGLPEGTMVYCNLYGFLTGDHELQHPIRPKRSPNSPKCLVWIAEQPPTQLQILVLSGLIPNNFVINCYFQRVPSSKNGSPRGKNPVQFGFSISPESWWVKLQPQAVRS